MLPSWPTQKIAANAIEIAYAEQGAGPLVLFCHGWPELSFSWRRQLPAFAKAGYRAVAPDMRGYGGTTRPDDIGAYTIFHHVADMVALVEALGEKQAIVVGHDWGALAAWHCALFRPDIFRAVAGLSVPYGRRGATAPLKAVEAMGIKNFYWRYFQEPGVAEAEFSKDWSHFVRSLLYGRGLTMICEPGQGMTGGVKIPAEPPPWIAEEEIQFYIETFARTGLAGGLNWYRNIDRNWELTGAWRDAKIMQPALFIAGARDPTMTGPIGAKQIAQMKILAPNLRDCLMIEGAGHWIQQERPEEVNAALLKFVRECDA